MYGRFADNDPISFRTLTIPSASGISKTEASCIRSEARTRRLHTLEKLEASYDIEWRDIKYDVVFV